MLQVDNLEKNYKQKKVLSDVSFQIEQGEVVGLVGENGAGKSTLLNILATVIKPSAGQVILDGMPYKGNQNAMRRHIGYVPQELSIWEDLTVEENMLFFEKLSWTKRTKEQCRELCLNMQLTQWEEKVSSLSGGMKRKLNMAISLLHDPKLLLLDEPTVGIDLKSKNEIGKYLVDIAKNDGKMVLYTSHDMNEIATFCDRVYVIGQDPFYLNLLKANDVDVEHLAGC
ncbi:ABC transporter ATP-binding protein [Solibacillus sp. CAU 1738]|uniref:ABC transporter ATP-binding protein n=1 Tax=Solibacillus sp. CAU 1738 TaxID=3140363 RepID=UPI003261086A